MTAAEHRAAARENLLLGQNAEGARHEAAAAALEAAALHTRGTRSELGYERAVCTECGASWPCPEWVKARCARLNFALGLPCECGWHEEGDGR